MRLACTATTENPYFPHIHSSVDNTWRRMGSEKNPQPYGTAGNSHACPSLMVDDNRAHTLDFDPPRNSEELQISKKAAQRGSVHDTGQDSEARACATRAANSRNTAFRPSQFPIPSSVLDTSTDVRPEIQEPEMDHSKRKPRSGAKTKRMREKYWEMMSLREDVSQMRHELMPLYQDLNAEVEKMRESEEVLLSSLEGEMRDLMSQKSLDYLRIMWDEVQTSRATFNDTIARALQYENLLRDPQEELVVAEDAFLEAAETVVASKSKANKSNDQALVSDEKEAGIAETQQPQTTTSLPTDVEPTFWTNFMTPSEASALGKIAYEVEESGSEPLVLSHLRERQVFLRMSRENLNELECEQEDDRIERELLLDRGDKPAVPESEFEEQYIFYREKHIRNINKALSDIERLKAECLAHGIDPDPLRKPESPSSTAYLPKEGDAMSVDADLHFQDDAGSLKSLGSLESAGQYRDHEFEARFGFAPVRRPAERPTRVLEWLESASGERKSEDAHEAESNTHAMTPGPLHNQHAARE